MKIFWTIFFLSSMLLVGFDVQGRRQSPELSVGAPIAGDGAGAPTPRP